MVRDFAVALFWVLILAALFACVASMAERPRPEPILINDAKITCIPPASHYQWKQKRIA